METIINKKARFNYMLEDTYEAGIVLEGWEVKPILARKVNLDASYVIIRNGEVFLINAQVNPEKTSCAFVNSESTRTRKLLLKKRQIMQLIGKVEQKGYTLIATKVYTKGRHVKIEIALAKGKNTHDKRETIKERDWEREHANLFKKNLKA